MSKQQAVNTLAFISNSSQGRRNNKYKPTDRLDNQQRAQ